MKITKSITLPDDAYAQTFGFFGRKGSGKTYAAGRLAEGFLGKKIQTVILDPLGNWYGLRLDASGAFPSKFKIPILGGLRGDVPLESTGGAVVADFIVSTGSSAVLDVSQFRKNERKRFVADFGEQLFHLKKSRPTPLHIIFEEAHVFAPQRMFKGDERMLGALEDIVRLGRNFGIGCSMVSQRPQDLNTSVRNQCEPLVVFQQVAKHERKAITEWMEHFGVEQELAELSKLKNGDCFFWSPAWLDQFRKVRFLEKQTYDSSTTPKVGSKNRISGPMKLQPVNLKSLTESMASTIESVALTDPKTLQRKIAKLERELANANIPAAVNNTEQIAAQLNDAVASRDKYWKQEIAIFQEIVGTNMNRIDGICKRLREIKANRWPAWTESSAKPFRPTTPKPVARPSVVDRPPPKWRAQDIGEIGKGVVRCLTAIAQHGEDGVTRTQLTVLTAYKATSRNTYIQRLKKRGLVTVDGQNIHVTDTGIDALGVNFEPLPTGRRLLEYWMSRLPEGERVILEIVTNNWPGSISRTDIDGFTEFKTTTRNTYIQRLKSKKLVNSHGGDVEASRLLFD